MAYFKFKSKVAKLCTIFINLCLKYDKQPAYSLFSARQHEYTLVEGVWATG